VAVGSGGGHLKLRGREERVRHLEIEEGGCRGGSSPRGAVAVVVVVLTPVSSTENFDTGADKRHWGAVGASCTSR
jgi:hypothetical protein